MNVWRIVKAKDMFPFIILGIKFLFISKRDLIKFLTD